MMPPQFDPIPTLASMKLLLPQCHRDLLCDGWMLPRMLLPLRTAAELEASNVLKQADWGFHRKACIPLDVLSEFETDMDCGRMAWANIWKVVALHLQRGMTPAAKRVRSVMEAIKSVIAANDHQAFLQHGGKVEHAIDALIQITHIVVMDGDERYECKMTEAEMEKLPSTLFDKDFDLAWVACIKFGGGNLEVGGPHHNRFGGGPAREHDFWTSATTPFCLKSLSVAHPSLTLGKPLPSASAREDKMSKTKALWN